MRAAERETERSTEGSNRQLRALKRQLDVAEQRIKELQFELDVARGIIDPWEVQIVSWLDKQATRRLTTRDILTGSLSIREEDQDREARLRLARIMKKFGWIKTIINTDDGVRVRGWRKRPYD